MLDNEKEIEFKKTSNIGALIGALLIVVAISAYVFFGRAVANDLSALKLDMSTKQQELETLRGQIDTYEKAKTELDLSTEVQRRESLKAVPVNIDQDEVIRSLLQIASKNGILLHSISFAKGGTDREGIGSLRISSSFEGNYKDLTDFLKSLEVNERIFKVDSINVQISKLDLVDIQRASFSLNIETYYQQAVSQQ